MTTSPVQATESYARDGYTICPPQVPHDILKRVAVRMEAVRNGEYETGIPPQVFGDIKSDPTRLVKIDQAHLSDRTIREVVTHPEIGRWAAAITGAKMVQVWAVQLLIKPPGGATKGNVGWHQDFQYWSTWWTPESEVFTCWVAVKDVALESGPMLFARGSHRWGFLNEGDFFSVALDELRGNILKKHGYTWDEVPATMPAGAFSFHHKHTYHGSGPNLSNTSRLSFAIHLRTEKSTPIKGNYYSDNVDDLNISPVIYQQ